MIYLLPRIMCCDHFPALSLSLKTKGSSPSSACSGLFSSFCSLCAPSSFLPSSRRSDDVYKQGVESECFYNTARKRLNEANNIKYIRPALVTRCHGFFSPPSEIWSFFGIIPIPSIVQYWQNT